ncbi:MAG TPA: hypothetical protein VFS43_17230 [Polyangiaceae bacterium]|nr:hypothetical protein [Polyangiaceae bacterium]
MKAVYESPWHNPILFLAVGAAFLIIVARQLPFFRAYAVLFTIEIMADALLTGGWSPLAAGSKAASAFAVFFVVLGDWRYFLLLERQAVRPHARVPLGLLSLLASLVVPVSSMAIVQAGPESWRASSRTLFLVYELLFAALAALLRLRLKAWAFPKLDPTQRPWVVALTTFELAQYAGWALADIVLLFGVEDLGYALRLVPNIMYYALFLPFAWFSAPREVRES